jgi:hypothetical protein
MNECDHCGQEGAECQCELRDLRIRIEELENAFKKMVTYVFKLEVAIKDFRSTSEPAD